MYKDKRKRGKKFDIAGRRLC